MVTAMTNILVKISTTFDFIYPVYCTQLNYFIKANITNDSTRTSLGTFSNKTTEHTVYLHESKTFLIRILVTFLLLTAPASRNANPHCITENIK